MTLEAYDKTLTRAPEQKNGLKFFKDKTTRPLDNF